MKRLRLTTPAPQKLDLEGLENLWSRQSDDYYVLIDDHDRRRWFNGWRAGCDTAATQPPMVSLHFDCGTVTSVALVSPDVIGGLPHVRARVAHGQLPPDLAALVALWVSANRTSESPPTTFGGTALSDLFRFDRVGLFARRYSAGELALTSARDMTDPVLQTEIARWARVVGLTKCATIQVAPTLTSRLASCQVSGDSTRNETVGFRLYEMMRP